MRAAPGGDDLLRRLANRGSEREKGRKKEGQKERRERKNRERLPQRATEAVRDLLF